MDKNTDLSKFGFEPGVTYDTARFFLHAGDIRDFYIAVNLSNIVNNGFYLLHAFLRVIAKHFVTCLLQ